jgi:hypothetical protein
MDKGKGPAEQGTKESTEKGPEQGPKESTGRGGSTTEENPDPIMVSTLAHYIKEDTQELNKAILS